MREGGDKGRIGLKRCNGGNAALRARTKRSIFSDKREQGGGPNRQGRSETGEGASELNPRREAG